MAVEAGISTNVNVGGSFAAAAEPPAVLKYKVKPDVVQQIVANLNKIQGRTDDSEIKRAGETYALMDKRTGFPLAKLDTQAQEMTFYKTPKEMAVRIDSAFISESKIAAFIEGSRAPSPQQLAAAQPPVKVALQ